MIIKKLPLFFVWSISLLCGSCIQEEPLNSECDILGIDSVWINENKSILIGSPVVTNTSVALTIKKGADRSQLNPSFYLTQGSSLTMKKDGVAVNANGATRDFTAPQIYTALSEDGQWSKDYIVSFNYPRPSTVSSFEHFELDKSERYFVWYDLDESDTTNPRREDWCSGNAGYAFTGKGKTPYEFPTCVDSLGYKGNGVTLTTCSTGSFGSLLGMPIAAGNIFIGEFKSEKATTDALGATRLGRQDLVGGRPLTLSGYYKFKSGPIFTDAKGQKIADRKDVFDIYGVLYEVDPDNFISLDGSNSLTSDRIVSIARISNPEETAVWTKFEIPFESRKAFDTGKLQKNGYAITVVATSSRDGGIFEGAVGSELRVDEIKITWEE